MDVVHCYVSSLVAKEEALVCLLSPPPSFSIPPNSIPHSHAIAGDLGSDDDKESSANGLKKEGEAALFFFPPLPFIPPAAVSDRRRRLQRYIQYSNAVAHSMAIHSHSRFCHLPDAAAAASAGGGRSLFFFSSSSYSPPAPLDDGREAATACSTPPSPPPPAPFLYCSIQSSFCCSVTLKGRVSFAALFFVGKQQSYEMRN